MTTHGHNKVDSVTIMITRYERDLIKRFGYPFEDIERQLLDSGDADLARVTDAPFYWEQLIINLRISVNEKPEIHRDEVLEEAVEQLIQKVAIGIGLI
ncbi:MAG: hypothetical protein WCS43_07850 [Verrucomicrobiota bacterium]